MDYLSRDSHHCGVGYGNFDYPRLLETIRVKYAEEGGLELSIERGGVHTLEAMVLARYWMFTQVYFHKTRRIYDMYLSRYLSSWYSGQYDNLLRVTNHDDMSLMHDMVYDDTLGGQNQERKKWAHRILHRQHHRVVYETNDFATAEDKKISLRLEKALREQYPDVDFMIDLGATKEIHKFYVRDVDEEMGEEFPVYDVVSRGAFRLSDESKVVKSLPKRFQVIRIYGDVPRESIGTFREFARAKAREYKETVL